MVAASPADPVCPSDWRMELGAACLVCLGASSRHACNPASLCSQQRAPGKVLFDAVCNHLNLVEGDYFGLEFPDHRKIVVGDRIHVALPSVHLQGGRDRCLSLTVQK